MNIPPNFGTILQLNVQLRFVHSIAEESTKELNACSLQGQSRRGIYCT
jgi:hypothetical protein